MSAGEEAELPDDIPTIKEHLRVRREAVQIMMMEIHILENALQVKLGPSGWVAYQADLAAAREKETQMRTQTREAGS